MRLELGEVPVHLLGRHALHAVRVPPGLIVAVDQNGPHALKEVVVFAASLAQAVLDGQHVSQTVQLGAFSQLPQGDLETKEFTALGTRGMICEKTA